METAGNEVDALSEDRILKTDSEELVRYFVEKFKVEVPQLQLDAVAAERHERTIEVYDRYDQRTYDVPGIAFDFEIPFTGDAEIFQMRPNTYDTGPPYADIRGGKVCFTVSGRDLSDDDLKRGFEGTRDSIQKYLNWHQAMWTGVDDQIARTVRDRINQRRERLQKHHSLASGLASLGVKLKEKPGDPRSYSPPAVKQKIEPKLPPMKPSAPPDPTLDEQQYGTILGLIRDAGRSIEQSSSRMRDLDEEALRDILLVPLNAHFGGVTGEAFNYSGKTDILIRHGGGNLFAAECKIWTGDKAFHAAIDQLLGYLTWRDTKAALVVFNRNKGFSDVNDKLRILPTTHSSYVGGPKRLDETSTQFTMRLPQDTARIITMSVLGFDLGPSKAA